MNYYKFNTKTVVYYEHPTIVADADVFIYDSVCSPDKTESIVKTEEISITGTPSNEAEYAAWC